MSPKKLLPLVVILAVLLILALWKRSADQPVSIVEQVRLEPLVSSALQESDIDRIEIYAGADPESKVSLIKDGDAWRVASHFDAPALETEVSSFANSILGLRGEYRADAIDESSRDAYGVNHNQAFHVEVFRATSETPEVHLLVGKSPDFRTVFLRNADSDRVYVEATNLRQEAGVFGEDLAVAPQPDKWLNKRIIDVPADSITKLAIHTPDRRWVFEKEFFAPEPEVDDLEESDADAVVLPETPEFRWVVAEGGLGEYRDTGLQALLRRFTAMDATNIVNPDALDEWGLTSPGYRIELSREEGEPVILEAGRPDLDGNGYLRLADADTSFVYELTKSRFDQLFPSASQLFTMPVFELEQDEITLIEIESPGEETLRLAKQADQWIVENPVISLPVRDNRINSLISSLADWSPVDYADADTPTGDFARSIRLMVGDEERMLHFADAARSVDGTYVRIDESPEILIVRQSEVDDMFLDLNDVYDRRIFSGDVTEYDRIDIVYEGSEWAFRLDDGELWDLSINGESRDVVSNLVEELLFALSGLEGSHIVVGAYPEAAIPWEPVLQISLGTETSTRSAVIGPEDDDGLYPVRVGAQPHSLPLTPVDYHRIVGHLNELNAMADAVEAGEVTLEELEADADIDFIHRSADVPEILPEISGESGGVQMAPSEGMHIPLETIVVPPADTAGTPSDEPPVLIAPASPEQ